MSSYRQKSSRACPCSDLNADRTSLVHLDTCSLGNLDSGRHLSRFLFGTCRSALVPCICFIPSPTLPSTTLGTRHLSGTSIKSPLYIICIVRLLYCGPNQSPDPCTYYDRLHQDCQVKPTHTKTMTRFVADISLLYHRLSP